MLDALLILLTICAIPAYLIFTAFQIDDAELNSKEAQLKRIKQTCVERFGLRIRPHRGHIATPQALKKWHVVRREDIYEDTAGERFVPSMRCVLLIQDQDDQEYFVTITNAFSGRPAEMDIQKI
jgi:hypothetical protein